GTRPRSAARRDPSGRDGGTTCGTKPPGGPQRRRAAAGLRPASTPRRARVAASRPRPRRATSTTPPIRSAPAARRTAAPKAAGGSRSNGRVYVGAISRGAEDDRQPQLGGKDALASAPDKREDAASKAGAHDPRPQAPVDRGRLLDKPVHLFGGDLE